MKTNSDCYDPRYSSKLCPGLHTVYPDAEAENGGSRVNFAKTFQLLRIRYGLTQEQFADQTGLGAISDIETGRREPPIDELEFCAKDP